MLLLNNKKFFKKILFIVFILINLLKIDSSAVVEPTPQFYVNDYANLLNLDTKEYIISINEDLYRKTGSQIVVVTIPNLEGDSLEEYSTKLFRKFGIGDKRKNNGVLLLLTLEERQFRIEVGYGLEGVLTDGKTGRIQDEYIIPYLKNNNWDDGIKNGFNAILDIVSNEYGVTINGAISPSNNNNMSETDQRIVNTILGYGMIIAIINLIVRAKTDYKKSRIIIRLLVGFGTVIGFSLIECIKLTYAFLLPVLAINMVVALMVMFASAGGYGGGSSFGRRWLIWR